MDQRQWLSVESFGYARNDANAALLWLLGEANSSPLPPSEPGLLVRRGSVMSTHPALACVSERRSETHLLWVAMFDVPLEIVEFRWATFALTAKDWPCVVLPHPGVAPPPDHRAVDLSYRLTSRRAHRYLVAVAAGVAVATGSAEIAVAASTDTTPACSAATTGTSTTGSDPAATTGTPGSAPSGGASGGGTCCGTPGSAPSGGASAEASQATATSTVAAPASASSTSTSSISAITCTSGPGSKDTRVTGPLKHRHKAPIGTAINVVRSKSSPSCHHT